MNIQQSPHADVIDMAAICAHILKEHKWQLADEPALVTDGRPFVQRVRERVDRLCAAEVRKADEKMVSRAVRAEYGILLHRAVSWHGHRLQSIGLEETSREGWKVARGKCNNHQDAESALYSALLKLWLRIDQISPETYFPYFFMIITREIWQQWRRQGPRGGKTVSLDDLHPNKEAGANPQEEDGRLEDTGPTGESAYQRILEDDALSSLVEVLNRCLQNPRATFVMITNYVMEMNPSEIAAQLAVTVNAIFLVKHHAKRRIKEKCGASLLSELRMRLQPA